MSAEFSSGSKRAGLTRLVQKRQGGVVNRWLDIVPVLIALALILWGKLPANVQKPYVDVDQMIFWLLFTPLWIFARTIPDVFSLLNSPVRRELSLTGISGQELLSTWIRPRRRRVSLAVIAGSFIVFTQMNLISETVDLGIYSATEYVFTAAFLMIPLWLSLISSSVILTDFPHLHKVFGRAPVVVVMFIVSVGTAPALILALSSQGHGWHPSVLQGQACECYGMLYDGITGLGFLFAVVAPVILKLQWWRACDAIYNLD